MASSLNQRLDALELENRKQRGINAALKARLKKLEPEEPAKEETGDK
jgi:hypothetical protein